MANLNIEVKMKITPGGKVLPSRPVQFMIWLPLIKLKIIDIDKIKNILLGYFRVKINNGNWEKFNMANTDIST